MVGLWLQAAAMDIYGSEKKPQQMWPKLAFFESVRKPHGMIAPDKNPLI